jgi:hypothetical protein
MPPPHSMAMAGGMSPMTMVTTAPISQQRPMAPQHLRQPPANFDPNGGMSSSQAGPMPHGNFIQQGTSMMAGQQPPQQQFAPYQQ